MLTIGCHLSSSKGYLAMGKEAVKINANTFQFFTRNPRGGKAKEINESDIEAYLAFAGELGRVCQRNQADESAFLAVCGPYHGIFMIIPYGNVVKRCL